MKVSSVYIHIPFCKDICSYCDFCKIYYNQKYINDYLMALENEIKSNYKNELVKTIYIGGGTPNSLSIEELNKLFQIIKLFNKEKDYEFTIECNIELVNEEQLILFKKNGVNRLSIGVQTFNDKFIKLLNRKHTKEEAISKIKLAKKYFNNISIDLIYALPNQTLNDLKNDLKEVIKLNLNHISLYSLMIGEHTKLYIDNYKNIDEDLDYKMYNYINKELINSGYKYYEISNYAKSNYESKHNLTYWNNLYYYGFGLGATGYIDNYRYTNTESLSKYLNQEYVNSKCIVSDKEMLENEFILGLRKIDGINKQLFYDKYHFEIDKIPVVRKLIKEGKLIDGDMIYINPKYLYISNTILLEFMGEL